MPTAQELLIICLVAVVASVTVVLTMHLIGLGQHAVTAAVAASSSSAIIATRSRARHRLRATR